MNFPASLEPPLFTLDRYLWSFISVSLAHRESIGNDELYGVLLVPEPHALLLLFLVHEFCRSSFDGLTNAAKAYAYNLRRVT